MRHLTSPSALVGAALASSLLACEQPKPRCSIARGDFAATYTLVARSGPCEPLRGEVLSVQAYTAPRSATDPRPDYDRTSVAIQPSTLTDLLAHAGERAPDPADQPFGLGAFASASPDAEDSCAVPALSEARVRLSALPAQVDACGGAPDEPAVDVRYSFSDLSVYVTAGAYGTQFSADLTLTRGECVAQYRVHAVYPAVSCGVPVTDPVDAPGAPLPLLDAGIALDAGTEPPDAGAADDPECPDEEPSEALVADDALCSPVGDPAAGRPYGSGINPDFAVQCDPELLLCVLASTPDP